MLVTVGFMIQPVWSTATPARSGFATAVETHPAGKIQLTISFLSTLPGGALS